MTGEFIAELRTIYTGGVTDIGKRFINLCNGDSFFTTEDQLSTDSLPIDDKKWAQNASTHLKSHPSQNNPLTTTTDRP